MKITRTFGQIVWWCCRDQRSVLQQKQNWKKWNSVSKMPQCDSRSRWRRDRCRRWYSSCQCHLLQSQPLELEGDEATGRNIVLRALKSPCAKLPTMPVTEGSIVIDRLKNAEVGTGFNAATGEWVNMIDAGIIDPVKGAVQPFKTPLP